MIKLTVRAGLWALVGFIGFSGACENPKKCDFKKGNKTSSEASIAPQKEFKRTQNSQDLLIAVSDMTCGECELKLEEALYGLKGLQKAQANQEDKSISVVYDKSLLNPEKILQTIKETGYSGTLKKSGEV